MKQKVIASMTTIPSRKERLMENLPAILNQTFNYDILLINIDDNLSDDEVQWYHDLAKQDKRIHINIADSKWRSCNKLLPALQLYSEDIIITIDDDIYYPEKCMEYLINEHKQWPNYIIAHEVNPLFISNNKIGFINGFDIKLKQHEWGKYLSNCALFPPHVFDESELFDYEKMMYITNGLHDELWFWLNSTMNKVKVIGLNYIKTFALDIKTPWLTDEFRLSNINVLESANKEYMAKINEVYGEALFSIVKEDLPIFHISPENVQTFCHELPYIKYLYNYGFKITYHDITISWSTIIDTICNKNGKFIF